MSDFCFIEMSCPKIAIHRSGIPRKKWTILIDLKTLSDHF